MENFTVASATDIKNLPGTKNYEGSKNLVIQCNRWKWGVTKMIASVPFAKMLFGQPNYLYSILSQSRNEKCGFQTHAKT